MDNIGDIVSSPTPLPIVTETVAPPINEDAPIVKNETQETKDTDSFSERFAKLKNMDKRFREEKLKFSEERKQYEEQLAKMKDLESDKELLTKNPLEFLKKHGLSYEHLSKEYLNSLNDEDLDPIAKLQKEYDKKFEEYRLETEKRILEEFEKKEVELKNKEMQTNLNAFRTQLAAFVEANKDTYELVANQGQQGLETIEEIIREDLLNKQKIHAKKYGISIDKVDINGLEVMTFEEATKKLEEYLDTEVAKYLSLNKVKQKFGNGVQTQSDSPRTITNEMSPKDTSFVPRTEQERMKMAEKLVDRMLS